MNAHEKERQWISALYDREATPEEEQGALDHLKDCAECRAYFNDLKKISLSLKTWKDEVLSPDLESKIRNQKPREGSPVKTLYGIRFAGGLAVGVLAVLLYIQAPQLRQMPSPPVIPNPSPAKVETAVSDALKPAGMSGPKTSAPVREVSEVADLARIQMKSEGGLRKAKLPESAAENFSARLAQPVEYAKSFGQAENYRSRDVSSYTSMDLSDYRGPLSDGNTESYSRIHENGFLEVTQDPLSTLSVDVDTASYGNLRRFLVQGQMPPADAVRVEEMINYFTYDYPEPEGEEPFSITSEVGVCPWSAEHKLVMVALQGKKPQASTLPPSNLTFLIDVSGSMSSPDKLPLIKNAFRLLTQQLRREDRVAIVVYAGSAGMVLPSTPGTDKQTILDAIDRLEAGGSTAGGEGIKLAYEMAQKNFISGGNNRVILATDGDFNVGVSSDAEMGRLIEEKRESKVFLTVLGVGQGNYKDSKMEEVANKGNGNYYYLDTLKEAKKVLVEEIGSTLFTIAKDVKLQVEFNPALVKSYRLVGYEDRLLAKQDFNNDKKDAGEIGAGHQVTAFYEIVPADSQSGAVSTTDPLKYQQTSVKPSDDLLTVKLRYKKPDENESRLLVKTLKKSEAFKEAQSESFRFAAAVAEFGQLLRHSDHKGNASYDHVLRVAKEAKGRDTGEYRAEFIQLVEKAKALDMNTEGGIRFKGGAQE